MTGRAGTRADISRVLVEDGAPLRVRRVTGAETARYRAPSGAALVAVVEVAVTAPVAEVDGREDELVSQLRRLEQAGPREARRILRALRRAREART